tara:strand:+ start:174 stop:437 length:264 start_codon:yes stop_codon:yes gene_type:complete
LTQIDQDKTKDLYEVRDFKISNLPVISLRLRVGQEYGLKQLAYQMGYENMNEVLAGIRYRFSAPVGKNFDVDRASPNNNGFGILAKI